MKVYTARMGWRGAGALPVTRFVVVDELGKTFAPSPSLLQWALRLRKSGRETAETWAEYERLYIEEMRASYRNSRPGWKKLLAMPEATLLCFCTNPERCHRTILARLLVKLGATYEGERT